MMIEPFGSQLIIWFWRRLSEKRFNDLNGTDLVDNQTGQTDWSDQNFKTLIFKLEEKNIPYHCYSLCKPPKLINLKCNG